MRKLNKNGLERALPLIEKALGINGKLKIDGDSVVIDEYKFSISIPNDWVVKEAMAGPVGADPDPSASVPAVSKVGGKERETGVNQLGRAAVEREEERKLAELAKKLSGKFLTKQEYEKYMKDFDDRHLDTGELKGALDKFSGSLG